MVVAIWGGHLPGQMLLVTSMEKGHIKKDFRSKLNVYDGNPPKNSPFSFHNLWPRSLLFQIPNILQNPPWPATTMIKSGAPLLCSFFQYRHQCINIFLLPNDHHLGFNGRRKGCRWYSEQRFNFPELFWVTRMTHKESLLSPTANFSLFYDVGVALDIDWEGELLSMDSEDKLQPVSQ